MNKPYCDGDTLIPTFAACRELVKLRTSDSLRADLSGYKANAALDYGRSEKRQQLSDYFRDMVRAIEDELLCRDYEERHPEPDNDDPWLDDYTIEDYQPGDYFDGCC